MSITDFDSFFNDDEHAENQNQQQQNGSSSENEAGSNTDTNASTDEAEDLKQALHEQKQKYIRLLAEFDNAKKRMAKEKIDIINTASKDIVVPLLDVLDDIERAESQLSQSNDPNQIKEGVGLVFNKFKNILSQKGVKPVDSKNKDFDSEQHEAITQVDAGPELAGKVVDEVSKGYTLNDKLIRFAKVVVGKDNDEA